MASCKTLPDNPGHRKNDRVAVFECMMVLGCIPINLYEKIPFSRECI